MLPALLLVALAVVGSLLLRMLYRRLRKVSWGELRWLALVLSASLLLAMAVDTAYHTSLALLGWLWTPAASLYEAQPALARMPLLSVKYLLWSLLYLALSRQQGLQQAHSDTQALKLALKDAEVKRLLGQLSPHFTFNALNNIRALILKDPDAARQLLTQFAATLRYQFAESSQALVPLAEELDTVHDYLDLVRLQLGRRLDFSEQVDPAVLAHPVPKFALQLLIENAVKHGLSPRPQPSVLRLAVRVEAGLLLLEVRNSGTVGDRSSSAGIGLRNLEQRMQLSHGAAATLVRRQEGELVLAQLRLPIDR